MKETADAWAAASGTQQALQFGLAETVRWIEWGLQSYFRVFLGAAFLLAGAALVTSRLAPRWLGALLLLAGLLSIAVGFDVSYSGLESDFQGIVAIAFQLVTLIFVVGLLVVGMRSRQRQAPARA